MSYPHKGLELMRGSGKPMEFGIFDFSRAFGKKKNGAAGTWNGNRGMSSTTPDTAAAYPGYHIRAYAGINECGTDKMM